MKYVPVIVSNGSLNVYTVPDNRTPTLEWLQRQIGGFIEVVRACVGKTLVMVVNEEGYFMDLPINCTATDLQLVREVNILGNAVILKAEGSDLVPLTMDDLKLVVAFCAATCDQTRKIEVDDDDD